MSLDCGMGTTMCGMVGSCAVAGFAAPARTVAGGVARGGVGSEPVDGRSHHAAGNMKT